VLKIGRVGIVLTQISRLDRNPIVGAIAVSTRRLEALLPSPWVVGAIALGMEGTAMTAYCTVGLWTSYDVDIRRFGGASLERTVRTLTASSLDSAAWLYSFT
jgi:hypothetical protein